MKTHCTVCDREANPLTKPPLCTAHAVRRISEAHGTYVRFTNENDAGHFRTDCYKRGEPLHIDAWPGLPRVMRLTPKQLDRAKESGKPLEFEFGYQKIDQKRR